MTDEKMNVMQQLLVMNIEQMLREFAAYRTFHRSDSVINMRIPGDVLDKVKAIAASNGVPYQALISSVLFSLSGAGGAADSQYRAQSFHSTPNRPMTPVGLFNPAMPSVVAPIVSDVENALTANPTVHDEPLPEQVLISPAND